MDSSETLKKQIIELQSIAWPLPSGTKPEDVIWPEDIKIHQTSFVIIHKGIAVCHVAVLAKEICHKGIIYKVYALNEVVTHPFYKRRGLGLQLIKKAAEYIEASSADISIFTCYAPFIRFYSRAGWEYMLDTCVVGGSIAKPLRSGDLRLSTMMRFYSDLAKSNRKDFENSDVHLELGERNLW